MTEPIGWADVYGAYDALQECLRRHELCRTLHCIADPRRVEAMYQLAPPSKGQVEEAWAALREELPPTRALVDPLRRDIHRASEGLVNWYSIKAPSVAEAVLMWAEYQAGLEWGHEPPGETGALGNQWSNLTNNGPADRDLVAAQLHLEAARVAKEQELKGPDLGRFDDTERRVYAALLLNGAMGEEQLGKVAHRSTKGGGFRGELRAMVRHGVLEKVSDGWDVRRR